MRLVDLHPTWVDAGGPGITIKDPVTGEMVQAPERHGVGVGFDCPCGCSSRCYVPFNNPIDGGGPHEPTHVCWTRTGETFENLSTTPSIYRKLGCGWHGFITNGEIETC